MRKLPANQALPIPNKKTPRRNGGQPKRSDAMAPVIPTGALPDRSGGSHSSGLLKVADRGKSGRSRPSRLNEPAVLEEYLEAIRSGATYRAAAQCACVPEDVATTWMRIGKVAFEDWSETYDFENDVEGCPYTDAAHFYVLVSKAEGELEKRLNTFITRAADARSKGLINAAFWVAAMTWLERRYPIRYAKTQSVAVEQNTKVTIVVQEVGGSAWQSGADAIDAHFEETAALPPSS